MTRHTSSGRVGDADRALVPAASSPQAVSTKGFDPSRWHDLIARNECAMTPDAEVFEDAFRLCFPRPAKIWAVDYVEWTGDYTEWQRRQTAFYELINAEGYLDAALSLVWPDPFSCRVLNVTLERDDDTWGADVWHPFQSRPDFGKSFCCAASALLDAVLRANLASAIEARQRTDPEEGLDPKGESATLEEGDAQGGPA